MQTLPPTALLTSLRSLVEAEGLTTTEGQGHSLTVEREIPLGKWFLGGRKAVYRASFDLDEATHDLRFRESTTQTSWGLPPPSLTVETTSQSGTRVRESTRVKTPGGDGGFEVGHVREAAELAATKAGWQFHYEAGRKP